MLTLTGLIRGARLMHFPLPLCMISFATVSAVLAPIVHFDRLLITYVIVFGSLCLASVSFDELKGRPLRTNNPREPTSVAGMSLFTLAFADTASFHRLRKRFLLSRQPVS